MGTMQNREEFWQNRARPPPTCEWQVRGCLAGRRGPDHRFEILTGCNEIGGQLPPSAQVCQHHPEEVPEQHDMSRVIVAGFQVREFGRGEGLGPVDRVEDGFWFAAGKSAKGLQVVEASRPAASDLHDEVVAQEHSWGSIDSASKPVSPAVHFPNNGQPRAV
jgi:hypothetical protein